MIIKLAENSLNKLSPYNYLYCKVDYSVSAQGSRVGMEGLRDYIFRFNLLWHSGMLTLTINIMYASIKVL